MTLSDTKIKILPSGTLFFLIDDVSGYHNLR